MASSTTLSVTDVVHFWSTDGKSILDATQPHIDKINEKLRNPEMEAWVAAGCTTNIYETLNKVVADQQIRQIRMAKSNSPNTYTTLKLDVKTAKAILRNGLSVVYKGLIYPTSHVDLWCELSIINQSIEQKALPLIKDKINPIPDQPLTVVGARDIYQAIANGSLYYGKTTVDNDVDTPHTQPAEELKLNLDCTKTEFIGAGAFGKTFKVWDIEKGKYFAIKQARIDDELEERELHISDLFRARGEELDPTLVKQYGYHYDRDNKRAFFIMEYVDHDTVLRKLLDRVENNYDPHKSHESLNDLYTKLPIANVADITYQLAYTLSIVHHAGIVHRDIKPSNFMLLNKTEKEQQFHKVKLFDFGRGKTFGTKTGETPTDFLTKTNTGNVMSQAPELGTGEIYNARLTDLYAIGMNALHLLFGYSPGFYQYYLDNKKPISKEEDLKQQRFAMPTLSHYTAEYKSFVEDANKTNNTNNASLLEARLAEFQSDQWADLREALGYLVDSKEPNNRVKFFESKFIKSQIVPPTVVNDNNKPQQGNAIAPDAKPDSDPSDKGPE